MDHHHQHKRYLAGGVVAALVLGLTAIAHADDAVTLYSQGTTYYFQLYPAAGMNQNYRLVMPLTPGVTNQYLAVNDVKGQTLNGVWVTPSQSGGGVGSSALEVMANGVRVSSPTASLNAVGNAAIRITGSLLVGTTAQLSFAADPSSVTLQGVITAASLGALTGNQTITLTGDSTGSGATAIAVTAAANQPNIRTLGAAGFSVTSASNTIMPGTTVYADGTLLATSVKGAGLSACGDGTHALNWGAGNFGCQAISVGGGIVSPGSFTWNNTFGLALSTVTVSSNTILSGATFYQGGPQVIGQMIISPTTGIGIGVAPTGSANNLEANGVITADTNFFSNVYQGGYYLQNTKLKPALVMNQQGSQFGVVENSATNVWGLGHSASATSLGTDVLQWTQNDQLLGPSSSFVASTSSMTIAGAGGLGVTYGVTAGSATFGIVQIASNTIIPGTTDYADGTLAVTRIKWPDGTVQVSSPPVGGAGGGLTNAPTINSAPQFSAPYYSYQGSSNTLSAFPGLTLSTATVNGGVIASTFTASSFTILGAGDSQGLGIKGSNAATLIWSTSTATNGSYQMAVWSGTDTLVAAPVPMGGAGNAVLSGTQTWTGGNALFGNTTFYGQVYMVGKSTITYSGVAFEIKTSTNNPTALLLNVSSDSVVNYGLRVSTLGATTIDSATLGSAAVNNLTSAVIKADASHNLTAAAAADVVSLFSACSGTQYLGADGVCHTAAATTVAYYGHGGNSVGYAINAASGTYCQRFDLPFTLTYSSITVQIQTQDSTPNKYSLGIVNLSNVILSSTVPTNLSTASHGVNPFDIPFYNGPLTLSAGQYAYCITGQGITGKLYSAASGSYPSGPWDPTTSAATSSGGAFPSSVTLPTLGPAQGNGNGLNGLMFMLHN